MKTYVNILFHNVEYWYEDHEGKELQEGDREHIHYMINEGYSGGEINSSDDETDELLHGWWQIKGFETQ